MRYSELFEAELYCRRLQQDGEGLLFWEWDERFCSAHAVFTLKEQKPVVKLLEKDFRLLCHAGNCNRQSEQIKQLVALLGGVKGDQLLYGAGVEGAVVLLAAWWPWMDQETFSLRLRLPVDPALPENREPVKAFRDWFGFD